MKLGSLFDGSGGFPLAGSLCGIEPVWAAEVEPYPIAVTRSRFPRMKHLGDVTKINGADIEPVDIITFGSPCQDLSVAGKRTGLKHVSNGDDETTRSGLFMEAIRIIKEMRGATNGIYPRFAVWENVAGTFSSNHGEDFRTVINEIVGIVEPKAEVPPMPKGGWPYADCYVGDGWSVAYRTFDAQYWGVPQRRRRIYLVADFAGECAWKILFERDGVRGYFETGRTPWKGTAADAERGSGVCDCDKRVTYGFPLGFRPENVYLAEEKATTLCNGTRPGFTAAICTKVYDARGNGDGEIVSTITGDHENRITDYTSVVCMESRQANAEKLVNQTPCLNCDHEQPIVFDLEVYNAGAGQSGGMYISESGMAPALRTRHPPGVCARYTVRRLTPTECARLQGFADNWGHPDRKDAFSDEEYSFWISVRNTYAAINGKAARQYTRRQMLSWYNKLHTDSAEYKMWGNGIALPCALYVMQGVKSFYQIRE